MKEQEFASLLKNYGAQSVLSLGGNFAAIHINKPDGTYIRVGFKGSTFQPPAEEDIAHAQAFALSLLNTGSWSPPEECVNGIYLTEEWNFGPSTWAKRIARFGSENADTYYDKARKLIDTDPQASVPYSLFYLAVMTRNGNIYVNTK